MFEADELSDRVAFINEGRIHAIAHPGEPEAQARRRRFKVRDASGGWGEEQSVPLDDADAGERLGEPSATPA